MNGDYFNVNDGRPSGVLVRNGVIESIRRGLDRTSVGIGADGTLRTDRVTMLGFWRGTGARLRVGLNDPPNENGYALFTRAYGATTPVADNAAELGLPAVPGCRAEQRSLGCRDERRLAEHRQNADPDRRSRAAGEHRTRSVSSARRRSAAR